MRKLTPEKFITLVIFCCVLSSCKKNDNHFYLDGTITSALDGSPMSDFHVSVQKQVIQNGVFGSSYSTATDGTTAGNGSFSLKWPTENFAALQLVAEKDQYITRKLELNLSEFSAGNTVTKNLSVYPEAFISVHVANTNITSPSDVLLFTFTNAEFDCVCCSNSWKVFSGASIDSSFQCKLYGERWLKYQKQIQTAQLDTIINDSIWCPAFQTSALEITY